MNDTKQKLLELFEKHFYSVLLLGFTFTFWGAAFYGVFYLFTHFFVWK